MSRRQFNPTPANGGRVALYVRVSALMGRGGDDFHSPDVQIDGMRNLISREGLREVAVVDDDIDTSGQTLNRRGVARIRTMVEAREIDVVAVYMLSRVGRNLAESLAFIRWLRERGVTVISVQEKIDESPEGQFMVGMWLNMAELQGNQIGSSWARIIERRARAGKHHGNVPGGFVRGPDGRLAVDPVLGPAVTDMFDRYARGERIADIAVRYAAIRGKPVQRGDVKIMLRNAVYIGQVSVNSSTAGLLQTPDAHPRLVDQQTWDRAQRRADKDRTIPARHLAASYSLTGLGVCAHCGHRLQVTHSTENPEQPTRRLFCYWRKFTKDCEGIGSPPYLPIETALLDEVRSYGARLKGNPAARAARQARISQAWTDVPRLERELEKAREAMGRLTERWARGAVPDDAYDRAMADLVAAETGFLTGLDVAQEAVTMPPPGEVVALVDRMLELWPQMSEFERNRGLKVAVISFVVRRREFWKEPAGDRIVAVNFRW